MVYHFTRDPLNTIISGYNYWKNGMEWWNGEKLFTVHTDRRFLEFNFVTNRTIDHTTNWPYECFQDQYISESNFPFEGPKEMLNDSLSGYVEHVP